MIPTITSAAVVVVRRIAGLPGRFDALLLVDEDYLRTEGLASESPAPILGGSPQWENR
jgi:hypothetical protein